MLKLKESSALTWACECFSDYVIGLTLHIYTNHKPLVPLFSTKSLDNLPVRIQWFHMRMKRFNYTISHVPGKQLVIADILSQHQQTFLVAVIYILKLTLKNFSTWFYKVFQLLSSVWPKSRIYNSLTEPVFK